jgi:flagellar hook assembly protein FlgD
MTYSLEKDSQVEMTIFNLTGQAVKILEAGERTAGIHTIRWDATDDHGNSVSSGVYLVILKAGTHVAQQRIVFMK